MASDIRSAFAKFKGEALLRLAIDGVFILAAGVLVFGGKQCSSTAGRRCTNSDA